MLLSLSLLGTLGLASIAAAKTITVEVGEAGLTFDPSTITADVGDEVAFEVYPGHSVVEGDGFANPCAFKPGGFFSGFGPKQTFTIAVTSPGPIWLYCSTLSHCQAGMVGVINPTGQNTLEAYAAAAKGTSKSTDPGTKSGGITPGGSGSSSSSAPSSASEPSASEPSASSSAPASSSASSEPTPSSSAAEATTTPAAGTNATVSLTASPPPVQQTGAASSAFTAETVMVNAFVGLVAAVVGWAGLL